MHPACREKQEAERRQAGEDLRALLERIAKDPSSAPAQSLEVTRLRDAAGLDQNAVQSVCIQIFASHAQAATAGKDVTEEEIKDLGTIMKALGLEAASVRDQIKDVARYGVLHQVRAGQLPVVSSTGLLLEDGELTHWTCPVDWTHEIVVEEIVPPEAAMLYPVCVDGRRACPPEDCVGIGGYENLLEILGNPAHEEYESTLMWLGGRFDPEGFDVNAVNRTLSPREPLSSA